MEKIKYDPGFPRPLNDPMSQPERRLPYQPIPDLAEPHSIFDLLNFRISEFYTLSGSMVTRLCEGELGITREEWQFVAMLAALGSMSPSQLAAYTTVDRSQASRTLRALVEKQLVKRLPVPGDGRRSRIELTAAGRAMYQRAFPRVLQVHQAVVSALDRHELKVLARCLAKLQARVLEVHESGLIEAQADRRRGGSRSSWQRDPET